MNYCDCGALLAFSPDDAHCTACYEEQLSTEYGYSFETLFDYDGGAESSDGLCSECGDSLCLQCNCCHEGSCSRSTLLKKTCWIGVVY